MASDPGPMSPTWRERTIGLINQGVTRVRALQAASGSEIEPALIRAMTALGALPPTRPNRLLLLSSARIHLEQAQKRSRSLILGDVLGRDNLSSADMAQLVQLRHLCSEALNLLNSALQDARQRA